MILAAAEERQAAELLAEDPPTRESLVTKSDDRIHAHRPPRRNVARHKRHAAQ